MAIHWTIPFTDTLGTQYAVNVYDSAYVGNPVTVTGAADTFVTAEDKSQDAMAPVRISTGYLNVINEGNIDGMLPTSPKSRFVQLVRGGSTVVWQGYLQQQQFTMPWQSGSYEMQFPVVSALGILDTKIEKGDVAYKARFAEYLRQAIAHTGATYDYIVYPAEFAAAQGESYDFLFRVGLQDRNWFAYRNSNVIDPDESRFDGMTWLEILSQVMQAFGYTLYEQGTTLYIVGHRGRYYNRISTADLTTLAANGTATLTAVSQPTTDIDDLTLAGTGTLDVIPAMKRVVVESQINPFQDDAMPQFNKIFLEYDADINVRKRAVATPGFYYYDKTLITYQPQQGTDVWRFREFSDNVETQWSPQDLTRDYCLAVYAKNPEGDEVLAIPVNTLDGYSGWTTNWVAAVKSASSSFFAGGYLSLHMSVENYAGQGATQNHRIKLALRLGNYYYSAASHSWTTTATTFTADITDDGLAIEGGMEAGGSGTLVFKIPDAGMQGDVELFIYAPGPKLGTAIEAVYEVGRVDVQYTGKTISEAEGGDYVTDTNRFVISMNPAAKDEVEISSALSSYISKRMGYGVMLAPDYSKPQEQLYSRYDFDVYLEQAVADTASYNFENARQVLSAPFELTDALSPIGIYQFGADEYSYLSVERQWARAKQTLQLNKKL